MPIEPTDEDILEVLQLTTDADKAWFVKAVRNGMLVNRRDLAHARTIARLRVAVEALGRIGWYGLPGKEYRRIAREAEALVKDNSRA